LPSRQGSPEKVHHVVDDHRDAALVCLGEQAVEVGERAVVGLDGAVVLHRIAVVAVFALEDRHQPQPGDAQRLQVVEPAGQAGEIADAVAVAVLVGANQHLHEHAAARPAGRQRAGHGCGRHGAEVGNGRGAGRGGRRSAGGQHAEGQRRQRPPPARQRAGEAHHLQGFSARAFLASSSEV
jgi:hypothetical protein